MSSDNKRTAAERQPGSAKVPLSTDDGSRKADRADDAYEDNDLGAEWRGNLDPNGRMKDEPKCP
jgi:hypothetical protein